MRLTVPPASLDPINLPTLPGPLCLSIMRFAAELQRCMLTDRGGAPRPAAA